jgi:hypothetical protein
MLHVGKAWFHQIFGRPWGLQTSVCWQTNGKRGAQIRGGPVVLHSVFLAAMMSSKTKNAPDIETNMGAHGPWHAATHL